MLTAVAALAVATLATAQASSETDAVTPARLAELVPDVWQGLEVLYAQETFDASGAAVANASYDDESDERASTDLSLGLTDLGPHRDATILVNEADVAAGRAERTEIGGYPAFVVADESSPTVGVVADRMWIRTRGFGPLFDAEALRDAVAALPLDRIAALSEASVAPEASYAPTGFTRGGMRSFLPERLAGLERGDGFYAEVHPTGVAWSGFPYVGTRDGQDVRVRATIWDLGTLADATRERLAGDAEGWRPFSLDGRSGFVASDAAEPRVLLYVDRFRVQIDAPGQESVASERLRGALDEIELDRLARLGELVIAPDPAGDPLLGQPALIAPDRLAEALPEELAGLRRADLQAEVVSYMGEVFDTATAQARYAAGEDGPAVRVAIRDRGLVTHDVAEERAAMRAVEADGRTFHLSDRGPTALVIVGDRVVVTARVENGSALDDDELIAVLEGVDLAGLEEVAATP